MSTRKRESGITLLELMAVSVVMSVLMVMVAESMRTLAGVRGEQRASFTIGDVADRVARRITADVDFTTRVFVANPVDLEYLLALDLGVGVDVRSNGARLPMLTTHGAFAEDPPGVPETGNILFLARLGPRLQLDDAVLDPVHSRIQTFQLCVTAPMSIDGVLDLRRFVSEPLVDYWELIDIADPAQRTDALSQLEEAGIHYAWDPSAPRTTGLFVITEAGELVAMERTDRIPCTEDEAGSRPFSTRHLRLAQNGTTGRFAIPLYARTFGTFPGGFEVKIDGASAGKLLLLRMIVEVDTPQGHTVQTEVRRLLSTKG